MPQSHEEKGDKDLKSFVSSWPIFITFGVFIFVCFIDILCELIIESEQLRVDIH